MRGLIWAIILFICSALYLFGQENTETRELVVLSISRNERSVPDGTLAQVDGHIKNLFINLGRFEVTSLDYRLTSADAAELVDIIRNAREQNADFPEEIRIGQQVISPSDFTRLAGSFVIVVPSLSFYEIEETEGGRYRVGLETSFTFIDVQRTRTLGFTTISTSGISDTPGDAANEALNEIPLQLSFELRQFSVFQRKTGIIDVNGGNVILEFGKNMGVSIGDEYAVVTRRVLPTGAEATEESGMVIIDDVKEDISTAKIVYAREGVEAGDQLRELPRTGFDTSAYARFMLPDANLAPGVVAAGVIGVKQSTSRGFFKFRPFVGAEVPFGLGGALNPLGGLYINIYGGAELNWHARRLQFTPQLALGVAGNIPLQQNDSFGIAHVGGFVQATFSYLLVDSLKLFVDLGYGGWFGLESTPALSYVGPMGGIGATYKY